MRLWDVSTGQPWGRPLIGHTSYVNGVAFSRSGRLLASAGADRSVRVWEVSSGKPYGQPFTGHTSYVNGVAFSPDEKLLASASADRSLLLWKVGFTSWRPAGCQLVRRNLSRVEWESFAQGLSYQKTCPGLPSGE